MGRGQEQEVWENRREQDVRKSQIHMTGRNYKSSVHQHMYCTNVNEQGNIVPFRFSKGFVFFFFGKGICWLSLSCQC